MAWKYIDLLLVLSLALLPATLTLAADGTATGAPVTTRGTGVDPVVLKGPGYHFSLTAADRWSIEPSGKTTGEIAHLFAYRDSSGTAPAVINVVADQTPEHSEVDFNGAIRGTLIAIKQDNPGLVLSKDSSIITATKQEALVFLFSREGTGLREAWAAVETYGAIIRIMYVARDEFGFRDHLPEFKRMVASYIDLAPKQPSSDKDEKHTGPEKVK